MKKEDIKEGNIIKMTVDNVDYIETIDSVKWISEDECFFITNLRDDSQFVYFYDIKKSRIKYGELFTDCDLSKRCIKKISKAEAFVEVL